MAKVTGVDGMEIATSAIEMCDLEQAGNETTSAQIATASTVTGISVIVIVIVTATVTDPQFLNAAVEYPRAMTNLIGG
jgi:hypothetical protein